MAGATENLVRIDRVPVDLTPAAGEVPGFTNRWYRLLVEAAVVREIPPDDTSQGRADAILERLRQLAEG